MAGCALSAGPLEGRQAPRLRDMGEQRRTSRHGPGLSTATEQKTLPQHLRLAEAVMWIQPHLTVVPRERFLRCSVLLVGLNAGSRAS